MCPEFLIRLIPPPPNVHHDTANHKRCVLISFQTQDINYFFFFSLSLSLFLQGEKPFRVLFLPTISMTINAPASAAGQQQGTQTVEKDEIWSTILTGVASSKMVPTKKLLVLGKCVCVCLSLHAL